MYHVHQKQHILYASSITFTNNLVCNTLLKLVSGRPTDQPTDIATYRAAIAANNMTTTTNTNTATTVTSTNKTTMTTRGF